MKNEAFILNDTRGVTETGAHRSTDLADIIKTSVNLQEPELLHKLKRVLTEIRYAENNVAKFKQLTGREKEIIGLIASGANNPEISRRLFISRRTVEQHRKNINRKLEVKSLPDIYFFAHAFNLV